ncbi:MAG: bifunctional UDP-N-acetylglucosamine diphosphorylase/glucosamine-1-phosphate N-acetyltransferase GlmU [Acidimicrobiia bacterium]
MSLTAVVLAAGQGVRMKSSLPKVLHRIGGRTLLDWVLAAVEETKPERILVVVGHGAELVTAALPDKVEAVHQPEQLGTGHAADLALSRLDALTDDDTVLIVYGDMPLLTSQLLATAVAARDGHAASLVAFEAANPSGYGRVLRARTGQLERIVEEKDASQEERKVTEVNAGVYAFAAAKLRRALSSLESKNAQNEYYLPDVLPIMTNDGGVSIVSADAAEVAGVNSHDQLAEAEAEIRGRINADWQRQGVWMQDPSRVYIEPTVKLAAGVRLYPGVHLEGATAVAEGAVIGPDVFAVDSAIGSGSRVWYSVLRSAVVGDEVEVGPYASLRPGTVLEKGSKAGTFVEMKNTRVGEGAKVPHLAYMGDATVGARTNVGAGTITCNYNGYEKFPTTIGADAFIGSDTMLVAPVNIGDGAVTGAGSVITHDVEPGALAVERAEQKAIPGYAQKLKDRYPGKKH